MTLYVAGLYECFLVCGSTEGPAHSGLTLVWNPANLELDKLT